jgi:D-tyrosyl-tRNA(Tyr) deacylase
MTELQQPICWKICDEAPTHLERRKESAFVSKVKGEEGNWKEEEDEHATEVLSRAVGEHVTLLDDAELVRLLSGLHDETGLVDSGLRVVGVLVESSDDTLSVDVAALVHEPACVERNCQGKNARREEKERKNVRGDSGSL